jgi:hypothetical protein
MNFGTKKVNVSKDEQIQIIDVNISSGSFTIKFILNVHPTHKSLHIYKYDEEMMKNFKAEVIRTQHIQNDNLHVVIFWVIMTCSLVDGYQVSILI